MLKNAFTLAEVEICPPRGPILHEIKISAKGGAVRREAETRGSEGKLSASECASEILPRVKQISKQAFTLAEVLITLAIIGVVAALTIPSVITSTQQSEFKTGLKKAVSVLNSAIAMNMAIEGESPYDNRDLYQYLQRHMSILKSGFLPYSSSYRRKDGTSLSTGFNYAFYTTDGMRFEFEDDGGGQHLKLHESDLSACIAIKDKDSSTSTGTLGNEGHRVNCGGCGSLGLANNPNNTTKVPCAILVDVNGDRKPNPSNVNFTYKAYTNAVLSGTAKSNIYKVAEPGSKLIGDIFTVLITEDRAVPYGVVAQKAMYEAQKY